MALLAAGAACASAQNFNLYIATEAEGPNAVNFKQVNAGDVIEVTDYHVSDPSTMEWDGEIFYTQTGELAAYMKMENLTGSAQSISFAYTPTGDFSDTTGLTTSYSTCVGNCFFGNPVAFPIKANETLGGSTADHFAYTFAVEFDNYQGTAEQDAVIQRLKDLACDVNVEFTATCGNQSLPFTSRYKHGELSSIKGIAFDKNAPAEYYNLQGQRVANPAKGAIYIVKQGANVTKQVIR